MPRLGDAAAITSLDTLVLHLHSASEPTHQVCRQHEVGPLPALRQSRLAPCQFCNLDSATSSLNDGGIGGGIAAQQVLRSTARSPCRSCCRELDAVRAMSTRLRGSDQSAASLRQSCVHVLDAQEVVGGINPHQNRGQIGEHDICPQRRGQQPHQTTAAAQLQHSLSLQATAPLDVHIRGLSLICSSPALLGAGSAFSLCIRRYCAAMLLRIIPQH